MQLMNPRQTSDDQLTKLRTVASTLPGSRLPKVPTRTPNTNTTAIATDNAALKLTYFRVSVSRDGTRDDEGEVESWGGDWQKGCLRQLLLLPPHPPPTPPKVGRQVKQVDASATMMTQPDHEEKHVNAMALSLVGTYAREAQRDAVDESKADQRRPVDEAANSREHVARQPAAQGADQDAEHEHHRDRNGQRGLEIDVFPRVGQQGRDARRRRRS
ncbi:hypothetical protein DIPPA_03293 [Diplonema papillatum]|nr:hypothetical protein DIPPA_03293 [Diplonema papillatum]